MDSAKRDAQLARNGDSGFDRYSHGSQGVFGGPFNAGRNFNVSSGYKKSGSGRRGQDDRRMNKAPWENKSVESGQFGAQVDGTMEKITTGPGGVFSVTQGGFGRSNEEIARLPRYRGGRGRRQPYTPEIPVQEKDDEKKGYEMNQFGNARDRRRPPCDNCGRFGHTTGVCFRSGTEKGVPNNKETIRCYSCRGLGHLAASCPRALKAGLNGELRPYTQESIVSIIEGGSSTDDMDSTRSSVNNFPISTGNTVDEDGLKIICKLMKDTHLRQKTARCAPELYDSMIALLVAHVQQQQQL